MKTVTPTKETSHEYGIQKYNDHADENVSYNFMSQKISRVSCSHIIVTCGKSKVVPVHYLITAP